MMVNILVATEHARVSRRTIYNWINRNIIRYNRVCLPNRQSYTSVELDDVLAQSAAWTEDRKRHQRQLMMRQPRVNGRLVKGPLTNLSST